MWNQIKLQDTKNICLYFIELIRITKLKFKKHYEAFNPNKESIATKNNLREFRKDPVYEAKSETTHAEEQELDQDR